MGPFFAPTPDVYGFMLCNSVLSSAVLFSIFFNFSSLFFIPSIHVGSAWYRYVVRGQRKHRHEQGRRHTELTEDSHYE